ncbi:MAG: alpha/beta hydrolase [Bdellovibrio sp.]
MKPESSLNYIYIPAKEKSSGKSPVLLVMHGVGSNEKDLAQFAETLDPRFAVISLRAPLTLAPNSFAWFHVKFTDQRPEHNREQAEQSRQLIKKFIEDLKENPDIDASKIVLLGFSQGTIMSLSLALTEPELVCGVIAISGRTLQEVSALAANKHYTKTPKILLIHGVNDSKLPLYHGEETAETLRKAHFDFEFKTYPADHTITTDMRNDIRQWLAKQIESNSR